MELQNVSIAFISRFHFHYPPHSTDRKWSLFAIQKITKAIFATSTKQFLLADEEFSWKKPTYLSSMEKQNVSIAFISRFHFRYSPHSTDRKWCLFAIQKITKAIFATPTKQFLLEAEELWKKTQITEQHGITEREYFVYLTFSFSLFTSFDREEVMFVCDSKDNKSYLRDTNETILASRWKVFIKKTQITEQHGITEREYWAYLTFSFSLFTSFNRQEVMLVYDSKGNKSYLRDTNETILASRWKVFIKKNPKNWAAWNYRTWVFRLSHVFIFIIHLIQQTGSEVCLRFKR